MDAESRTRAPQLKHRVVKVAKYYDPRTWKEKGLWWTAGLFLVTYLVVMVVLSLVWSRSPGPIDINRFTMQPVGQDATKLVPGTMTTAAAIAIGETLLDKPGGYLTNDIAPPGIFLDNIPNWEFGALTELRDLSRALRNDFSRAQTQSAEDVDLQTAEPKFNYDSHSWIFPSSESEYRDGIAALQRYLARLADDKKGDGEFFSRADNLAAYLQVVAKRLGSLSQRLSYAVGQAPLDTALAGDASATEATPDTGQTWKKTPWLEIDDVFFEARGYTWALLQTLTAMETDFAPVLEKKNALVSLKQIVRELDNTQNMIWSPMILNGTGFGPMSNHSLVMASYISRANAAIIDLRRLLIEG